MTVRGSIRAAESFAFGRCIGRRARGGHTLRAWMASAVIATGATSGAAPTLAAAGRHRHPRLGARADVRVVGAGAPAVVPVAVRGRVHVAGRVVIRRRVIGERIHVERRDADEGTTAEAMMEPRMAVEAAAAVEAATAMEPTPAMEPT